VRIWNNGEASSGAYFVVGNPNSFAPIFVDFGIPVSGQIQVTLISVGWAEVMATAFNATSVPLTFKSVTHLNDPLILPNGYMYRDTIMLTGDGIARVSFGITRAYSNETNPIDGFGIDDMSFPSPVPEPSTMLFVGSGLVGLVVFRKWFKRA
jgi:hypothetical protein